MMTSALVVIATVVSIIAPAQGFGPMGPAPGPSNESHHHGPEGMPQRPPSVVPRPVVPPIPISSVTPLPQDKQELIDAIINHLDTNQRGQGVSKDFISMADPDRVRAVITNNVDSVTIDPAANTPFTKDNFTDKNSAITLKQSPKDDPVSAFHEVIHSGNFGQGGDGILDAVDKEEGKPGRDGDATNYVPQGFMGTLGQAKNLDQGLDRLITNIGSGTATKQEIDRFRNSLNNWSTRAQDVKNDPGMQKVLDTLGGKYDPQGYVNAVNNKLDQALGSKPGKSATSP
jgi:hypothetical protein